MQHTDVRVCSLNPLSSQTALYLQELRPWIKWTVLVCGHAGALARAALFCFVSVLMIRCLQGYRPNNPNLQREGAAFNQLTVQPRHLTAMPRPVIIPHPSPLFSKTAATVRTGNNEQPT